MARHIEAWMDGAALSSLGPFLIQGAQEDPAETQVSTYSKLGADGSWFGDIRRTSLRVTLLVAIRELYDLSRRASLAETLAAWAQGRVLELSNRPNRRLRVRCTTPPALGSVRSYTEELRVEWTAWAPPYWEDNTPTLLDLSGAETEGSIHVPGTAESPLRLTVTPSSALTDFTVTAGGQTITLEELAVPAGTPLIFDRDARDGLRITAGGVSQMMKRTAASADDLFLHPGMTEISFSANTGCRVRCEARGRWL